MHELATEEQLRQIYSHFNTTEEALRADAEYLREWMQKQPHLPNISDLDFLMNVILRSKMSMEKSKKFVDRYYTARALDDMFSKRDIGASHIHDCIRLARCAMLPKLTPDNQRLFLWGPSERTPETFPPPEDTLEMMTTLLDITLKVDRVTSSILLCDLKHMNLQHAAYAMATLKKILVFAMQVIHQPHSKIYIINLNPMYDHVLLFAKRIIKKKMADRIEIWKKKPTDLPEIFPKNTLPSDYGGDLPSIDEILEAGIKYAASFREWIIQERHVKADLSKRPKEYSKENDVTSIFGTEGSFKKLIID